jgi:hypothetical protein
MPRPKAHGKWRMFPEGGPFFLYFHKKECSLFSQEGHIRASERIIRARVEGSKKDEEAVLWLRQGKDLVFLPFIWRSKNYFGRPHIIISKCQGPSNKLLSRPMAASQARFLVAYVQKIVAPRVLRF